MFQCRVQQINNGFLVEFPGMQVSETRVIPPRAYHCPDSAGVIELLNKELPTSSEDKQVKLFRPE